MTTGEYLVAHSSLPTGTAMAHLLALQIGTGAGVNRVIYCSQMTTVLTQDEIVVTRKPKLSAHESAPAVTPAVVKKSTRQQATFFTFSPQQTEIVSLFDPDEITVTQRTNSIVVQQVANDRTITHQTARK